MEGLGKFFPAASYAWFAVAYVAFIASGALPSEARPGRRPPARVVMDRALFFVAVLGAPLAIARFLGLSLRAIGVSLGSPAEWLPLTLALSAAAYAIGRFSKKSEADKASYPQFLPPRWDAAALSLEVLSWAAYLLAYEFAFRGYLLAVVMPLGPGAAVAVTTALYAVAHLPKSAKEAAGALVFGVVASALALRYGSFLPAFLAHLAIALGNDRGACIAGARQARPGASR